MTITFEPVKLPFKVGDIVFVNEEHGQRITDKKGPVYPYFQAKVERIYFDGRLEEMSVITEPVDTYQLSVSTAVYELKPMGIYQDLVKVPIKLNLPVKEPKLFATEESLKEYLHTRDHLEKNVMPSKPE